MTLHAVRRTSTKGEKLAQRLSHILGLLHQGDSIDKHQLAREFNVDVRTIERDLGERLLNIAERNDKGHWQLVSAERSTIPTRHLIDYARLVGTHHLFPDSSLRFTLEQLHSESANCAVKVQQTPGEDLREQKEAFALLQKAIEERRECHLQYKGKARRAQPYRLIHRSGIWYLAAVEGGRLKNFSVGLITALHVDEASCFKPDQAHHDYINCKDDVWFTPETTEVLLRVSTEAAHYFSRRPLLPKQQNRADADGSLLVTTHINHPQQLLPIVRYWLPYVRILQPVALHEALLENLRATLAMWAPDWTATTLPEARP